MLCNNTYVRIYESVFTLSRMIYTDFLVLCNSCKSWDSHILVP